MTRSRTMRRRILVAAATATLCVAVMGVAAATRDRAPSMDDALAAPHAALPVAGALEGSAIREEAGMLVAGMMLIGAAAAVRRAA